MAARDKNISSILQSELIPSDSDDDDESAASSEGEYAPSDESDSKEEYIEENLHYIEEECEPEDEELLNEKKNAYAPFIRIDALSEIEQYGRQLFHKDIGHSNTTLCTVELDQKIYPAF